MDDNNNKIEEDDDEEKNHLSAREIEAKFAFEENLEDEAELEVQAHHWGREGVCTYDAGYVTQNVYLCRTCSSGGKKVVVCFGCSLDCHSHHDILELWKKRAIRCDCGVEGQLCSLREKGRIEANTENKYVPEQNYEGLFCWCHQPYNYDDALLVQCVCCSDWYHDTCVLEEWRRNQMYPDITTFSDNMLDEALFICRDCVTADIGAYLPQVGWWQTRTEREKEEGDKNEAGANDETKVEKEASSSCVAPTGQGGGSCFVVSDFQDRLCKCARCAVLFEQRFLESDDEEEEEEEGNNNGQQSIRPIRRQMSESLNGALGSISHDQQVQLAHGYVHFKELVVSRLQQKYESGKRVIEHSDIQEIKDELESLKKKRKDGTE